ncbi:amidophosphoribosyltransferase [Marivibrio halodurans]|uniref:Amidophosphoribosyltransferase n=1 Tax=Marivibrio halodurans TaxID=2039722 RepID=A0A8J7S3B6_9PROT|nr:amidophosphoribosyltransferase [Marivibrio halodurans]MBP5855909.1 amidophosphoribosyltransferase [Marivibrio halodurans]
MARAYALTTNPFDDDKLREECAVFGIHGTEDAAAHAALGLHALQHRGQEASGIVTYDGAEFRAHRALGQVGDVFGEQQVMDRLKGSAAIGHNRYSTTGDPMVRNTQPLFADFEFGGFAVAHNGNLTNAVQLRRELVHGGSIFQSTTDTEVIVHLLAQAKGGVTDRLTEALRRVEGAYSLVCLTRKKLIGVRDPLGVRPLVLGKLGDAHILASETCALDIIGAEKVRDVKAGEMIVIDDNGITSTFPFPPMKTRFCVFEYVYFSRPDSIVEGHSVYAARTAIGRELAAEHPIEADVIVPIPDSGVPSAIGYAEASGIPFQYGIIRNHYVGRTFIEPTDEIRNLGVKLKHNANREVIEGKRIVLIDDSIVRGTTSRKIVEMMRHAGATEVHMCIASPPTTHSCFYGVDTPERDKLLAARNTLEEMRALIGCDSLAFISMDGLYRAVGLPGRDPDSPQYCDACFSGDYPIRLTDQEQQGGKTSQLSLLREQAR